MTFLDTQTEAIARAIGRTLGINPAALQIRRVTFNERRTAAHVRVDYRRDRLFAKVLFGARVPRLTPTFMLGTQTDDEELRSAGEQIALEWESAERLQQFSAADGRIRVPRVKAASETEQVIVWERAGGVTLEQLLRRSAVLRHTGETGRRIGRSVGSFLSAVHGHFAGGRKSVILGDCAGMIARARRVTPDSVAILDRALEALARTLGDSSASLPLTFVHGDLSLSNLMWDSRTESIAVVDLEHSREDVALFDLAAWIYGVRVCLFWPLAAPALVQQCELGFWEGYGCASVDAAHLYRVSELIAIAWVFGYFLPERVPSRERGTSGLKRLQRMLYRRCVKNRLLASRLETLTGSIGATVTPLTTSAA